MTDDNSNNHKGEYPNITNNDNTNNMNIRIITNACQHEAPLLRPRPDAAAPAVTIPHSPPPHHRITIRDEAFPNTPPKSKINKKNKNTSRHLPRVANNRSQPSEPYRSHLAENHSCNTQHHIGNHHYHCRTPWPHHTTPRVHVGALAIIITPHIRQLGE